MTSNQMTMLGAFGAMLAFCSVSLPDATPDYIEFLIGSINAFVVAYLGKSNPGTKFMTNKVILDKVNDISSSKG